MRVVHIHVDLTEASRHLVHVVEQIPVRPNSVAVLATPVWVQETHQPRQTGIAGLRFSADDKTLQWRRSTTAASEYHVQVPPGVDTVQASFDAIVTAAVSRKITTLRWENVLLYAPHRQIDKVIWQAAVTVPRAWGVGTSLRALGEPTVSYAADGTAKTLLYHPTTLETLEDSPVLTGLHYAEYPLTADGRHFFCVAADTTESSVVPQETLDKMSRLVPETWAVFGRPHYREYRFLVALTAYSSGYGGREHHESCDITLRPNALADAVEVDKSGDIFSHEYIHSWNGKFRRPAGHAPGDFASPLDGSLLWVYEGLTQYYGLVLAVRCRLTSQTWCLAEFARIVAVLKCQTGRAWRSVGDTAVGCPATYPSMWTNWSRGVGDYYSEGALVWLDVDTLMRTKTSGQRSLDDFAREFFGLGGESGPSVVQYTYADLVEGLNKAVAHDWDAFFQERIWNVAPEINTTGIERAGYRFAYSRERGEHQDTKQAKKESVWFTIGLQLSDQGELNDVRRGGPADTAKLAPGQVLTKIGDDPFNIDALLDEIDRMEAAPIRVTVTEEDDEWEVEIDYRDGLRYPRLEPVHGALDLFSAIFSPLQPESIQECGSGHDTKPTSCI